MAVVSTTPVYRGLKAFPNARDRPRSLILGLDGLVRCRYERLGVYPPTSEAAFTDTIWFDHEGPPDSDFAVIWPWTLDWTFGASIR